MAAIRMNGYRALSNELLSPGDTVLTSEIFQPVTTVGAATLSAAAMLNGVLYRSGSTAGYTDTFDTATNILLAMSGNLTNPAVSPGLSFKMRLVNSVAFAETITLGAGMIAGSGVIATVAASSYRDFLFSFTSVQPPISNIANTTSGSAVVTWYLPPGQTSEPQGPSPLSMNIMPGCTVTGTGVPANTTVIGITQGQGGTLGFTMSANATATGAVTLSFGPTITVSSSGSGTL